MKYAKSQTKGVRRAGDFKSSIHSDFLLGRIRSHFAVLKKQIDLIVHENKSVDEAFPARDVSSCLPRRRVSLIPPL